MGRETKPLLKGESMPKAPWAEALPSARDGARRLPQAIAHRGYKASWPENTMNAFKGAVQVGAHAIETDTHLSRDGVVVIAHDPSLKRCFGLDKNVSDCDWEELSMLKTVRAPHERMPRLRDVLEWLAEPGLEKIWLLLDIKIDDPADALVGAIAETLADVPSPVPWDQRVVLGCWNSTFIKTVREILPNYAMSHIGASLSYSRYFFPVKNLGFNIRQEFLVGPFGHRFMRDVHNADRQLFVWTVNKPKWMEWCIRKNLVQAKAGADKAKSHYALINGVITDDPKLYLEVCERYEDELDGKSKPQEPGTLIQRTRKGLGIVWELLFFHALVAIYFTYRRWQGKIDYFNDKKIMRRL